MLDYLWIVIAGGVASFTAAMGPNVAGVIGSAVAAGVMIQLLA